jgi:hypothetical protein
MIVRGMPLDELVEGVYTSVGHCLAGDASKKSEKRGRDLLKSVRVLNRGETSARNRPLERK